MIIIFILYSAYKKLNYQCCLVFMIFAFYIVYTNLIYFGTLIQDGLQIYSDNK